MCLSKPHREPEPWNWDGERIVQDTIVPSSRPAIGSKREYDMDVREFLATAHNAVLRRTIQRDIRSFVRSLYGESRRAADHAWAQFQSSEPGSFDYRASVVAGFVSSRINYGKEHANENPWQFPEETLTLKSGLCEDRAFLSGIAFVGGRG